MVYLALRQEEMGNIPKCLEIEKTEFDGAILLSS